MARIFWTRIVFAFVLLLGCPTHVLAQDGFSKVVRVCVRPPGVPENVDRWSYTDSGTVITPDSMLFRAVTLGKPVFIYSPGAPRSSPKELLGADNKLKCPTRVLAQSSVLPNKDDVAPQSLRPEDRPQLILGTCHKPLLPTVSKDRGQKSPMLAACGDCRPKAEKSLLDKAADEAAHLGAMMNLQMNEEQRADGKKYGIPGGKNPFGPNSAVTQFIAGSAMIVMGVLTSTGALQKALTEAIAKRAPLRFLMKKATQAELATAEAAIREWGSYLPDALRANGSIGPYGLMQKFTEGMGGRWQAHHIIEKRWKDLLKIADPDRIPSVILTEAEHKFITAELAGEIGQAPSVQKLWEAYRKVYAGHPHWLEAIEPYFTKKP